MNGNETTGLSAVPQVNYRALAMLRAVRSGRAQLTCSSEPDLFIDGLPCSDQFCAHTLAHQGLVRPARPGRPGERVPAVLTDTGYAVVTSAEQAAA